MTHDSHPRLSKRRQTRPMCIRSSRLGAQPPANLIRARLDELLRAEQRHEACDAAVRGRVEVEEERRGKPSLVSHRGGGGGKDERMPLTKIARKWSRIKRNASTNKVACLTTLRCAFERLLCIRPPYRARTPWEHDYQLVTSRHAMHGIFSESSSRDFADPLVLTSITEEVPKCQSRLGPDARSRWAQSSSKSAPDGANRTPAARI